MWSEDRREELIELGALLRDAASLNSANGTIERMHRLIERAEALTKSDLRAGRDSFIRFLEREALTPND